MSVADTASGLLQTLGYWDQREDLKNTKQNITGAISGLQDEARDVGNFTGYTTRSNLGNLTVTPDSMETQLSWPQQYLSGQGFNTSGRQMNLGRDFWQEAAMPRADREADIYERIRATQRPEEGRQLDQMRQTLFNMGRGSIGSTAYGGTPEEMAYYKAQAEARNEASLSAIDQARLESESYGKLGNSAFDAATAMQTYGFQPYEQLRADARIGVNNEQLENQRALESMSLLAQLGLGDATVRTNISNILGRDQGTAITALAPLFGEGVGGLWDFLSKIKV